MGKIVAIGGGEITQKTTLKIDKRIVELSGKKKPKLLFIPTASNDSEKYCEIIKKHFEKLNCKVSNLLLIKDKLRKKEIENKILKTDIIYVGGGNTLKMMNLWRKIGVDLMLKKAHKKEIVLCGLSAGSICWFSYGNSDSRKFTSGSKQLIKVKGLGLIDALHCPHYDAEKHRQSDLKRMMKTTSRIVSIAIDNDCAIEVVDDQYRIIKSKSSAKAHKIYWKGGDFYKEEIVSRKDYQSIDSLLRK